MALNKNPITLYAFPSTVTLPYRVNIKIISGRSCLHLVLGDQVTSG